MIWLNWVWLIWSIQRWLKWGQMKCDWEQWRVDFCVDRNGFQAEKVRIVTIPNSQCSIWFTSHLNSSQVISTTCICCMRCWWWAMQLTGLSAEEGNSPQQVQNTKSPTSLSSEDSWCYSKQTSVLLFWDFQTSHFSEIFATMSLWLERLGEVTLVITEVCSGRHAVFIR